MSCNIAYPLGRGHLWRGRQYSANHTHLHTSLKINKNTFLNCNVGIKEYNDAVSVQFSPSVVSDSLRPHELQHARPPCLSPTPRVYSNSCPLSQWCHPTISSSVVPSSSCSQSFPESGSFQMSQFFVSGDQNIEVSASASVRTDFL